MRFIRYTGDLWSGQAVHPELWTLLGMRDVLIEIASERGPAPVVLGVPHHAGAGVARIAESARNARTGKMGRPADELAGLCGLAVFQALQKRKIPVRLVIAAHAANHDPNKTPGSPYWERIFTGAQPGILLELHGAAGRRLHALELSAGSNMKTNPLYYGRLLQKQLTELWTSERLWPQSLRSLAIQSRPGESSGVILKDRLETAGKLQNPALETLSLIHAGQLGTAALHLEMKPDFRKLDPARPDHPKPSPLAVQLSEALAGMVEQSLA